MISENFIFVGFALEIIGGVNYVIDVLRGKARPNRVTWALWAAAPIIAFLAQLDEGVGIQSLMTLSVGLSPLLVFIASFVSKKAYWELKPLDWLFGILAVLGLALWQITGEGAIAIAFGIAADSLAAIPTIIKSFHKPETESALIFGFATINALILLLTLDEWTFEEYGFALYIFIVAITLFTLIQFEWGKKLVERRQTKGSA